MSQPLPIRFQEHLQVSKMGRPDKTNYETRMIIEIGKSDGHCVGGMSR